MRKHKLTKRIFISIGVVSVVIVLLIGGYIYGVLGAAHRASDSAFVPLKTTDSQKETTTQITNKDSFTILLMGVDSRDADLSGRSDTMIVATVNPKTNTTTMVSIPRDTYVEGTTINKLNSAYADGGAENTIKHINTLLDIKINHYATLNFRGLVQLIDSIGGISVQSPLEFTTSHTVEEQGNKDYHFVKGLNDLNGEKALAYSRERYNDPSGDYGRQARQAQVIQAVLTKIKNVKTLNNYNDLFNILGSNVKTDLSWDNFKSLFTDYRNAFTTFNSNVLKGDGQTINGLSYQIASKDEINRIHNVLIDSLN